MGLDTDRLKRQYAKSLSDGPPGREPFKTFSLNIFLQTHINYIFLIEKHSLIFEKSVTIDKILK